MPVKKSPQSKCIAFPYVQKSTKMKGFSKRFFQKYYFKSHQITPEQHPRAKCGIFLSIRREKFSPIIAKKSSQMAKYRQKSDVLKISFSSSKMVTISYEIPPLGASNCEILFVLPNWIQIGRRNFPQTIAKKASL